MAIVSAKRLQPEWRRSWRLIAFSRMWGTRDLGVSYRWGAWWATAAIRHVGWPAVWLAVVCMQLCPSICTSACVRVCGCWTDSYSRYRKKIHVAGVICEMSLRPTPRRPLSRLVLVLWRRRLRGPGSTTRSPGWVFQTCWQKSAAPWGGILRKLGAAIGIHHVSLAYPYALAPGLLLH